MIEESFEKLEWWMASRTFSNDNDPQTHVWTGTQWFEDNKIQVLGGLPKSLT